jgi:hypothetical protein
MNVRTGTVARITRMFTAWNAVIDFASARLACVLLIMIGIVATARSSLKPFWYDELANFDVARLPTLSAVWSFFASGLDTPGPLPSLIQHIVIGAFGTGEVVNRMPVEAGFLLMCFALYLFVSRRFGPGFGMCALIIPALADVFYFATELRAYGLVLGGISLALVCWQGASLPRRRLIGASGLFLGLSLAVGCHAFAIFAVIPFFIAQFVKERDSGERDYAIWTAMGFSPAWLLLEIPGMRTARQYYAASFWSKPHPSQIFESYSLAVGSGWVIPVLFAVLLYCSLGTRGVALSKSSTDSGFSRAEWTIAIGLALLPCISLPFSYLLGAYVPRYAAPVAIGVSLLVTGAVAETVKRNRNFASALAALLVIVFLRNEHVMLAKAWHTRATLSEQVASLHWVEFVKGSSLPVLIPNASVYLPSQYYASATLEPRLFYALHAPAAVGHDEDSGNALNMQLFSRRMPLRVVEYSAFVADHPQFLVVLENPLDASARTASPKVELLATFAPAAAFANSYYSVYLVTAGEGQ